MPPSTAKGAAKSLTAAAAAIGSDELETFWDTEAALLALAHGAEVLGANWTEAHAHLTGIRNVDPRALAALGRVMQEYLDLARELRNAATQHRAAYHGHISDAEAGVRSPVPYFQQRNRTGAPACRMFAEACGYVAAPPDSLATFWDTETSLLSTATGLGAAGQAMLEQRGKLQSGMRVDARALMIFSVCGECFLQLSQRTTQAAQSHRSIYKGHLADAESGVVSPGNNTYFQPSHTTA